MSNDEDEDQPNEQETQPEQAEPKEEVKKPYIPPTKKGFKNDKGDYVVTSINIPDLRDGLKDKKETRQIESDSDSDEGYGDEDEPAQQQPNAAGETEQPK